MLYDKLLNNIIVKGSPKEIANYVIYKSGITFENDEVYVFDRILVINFLDY